MLKGKGNVDVQVGGPGNAWQYLSACASMSGPTVPEGSIETRWCQDPENVGGFKRSSRFRTAPDMVSFDLMTKLGAINKLKKLDCSFGIRARYACNGSRTDPNNYDPIMLSYTPADINEHSYDDLVVTDPSNEDEIQKTAPIVANSEYVVEKMNSPARLGTLAGLGDAPINDLELCDSHSCGGACGGRSDGCQKIYGVTDADTTPYANPQLITGTKDFTTGIWTWSYAPILGINGNVNGVECAGSRIIVHSNADSVIAYNDAAGDQDEWNLVTIAQTPSTNPNALFARTSREIWLACNSGYLYKSIDGGLTWTSVGTEGYTSQNLNAVFAYDDNLVYVVGNTGIILKSTDGGETWQDKTEVATTAANLLVVKVPPNRSQEVYIGTNDGQIFRSKDQGDTFTNVAFTGDGNGTIDDIEFVGPYAGEIMFILHNDSGPRGRVLRDLSGGNGASDVEIVANYTEVITAGVDLNALTVCDVNQAFAGGEVSGGYPAVLKLA